MTNTNTTKLLQQGEIYRAVWRWHFYAGLFVIPFLLILSLSGLLMLVCKPLEPLLHQGLMFVQPQEKALPAATLLANVRERYPDGQVQLYIPPRGNSKSARFSVVAGSAAAHSGHNQPSITVYVNPYSGEILGTQDPAKTLLHLPHDDKSVWTVSATTIVGDLTNPLAERTLHIDPSNGQVLADLKFTNYPAMGKAMAAFIPLHQGDFGLWNLLVNLLLVALVIVMIICGTALWWKRTASSGLKLDPPPAVRRMIFLVMLAIAICFPLSAVVLALAIIFDWLLISQVNRLRAAASEH